jgi:hypothetical protein
MPEQDTNHAALALNALAWTVAEPNRAERLLALTGLTAGELRSSADRPATLAAVLGFLEGHEPDLVACAEAIGVTPADLVTARRSFES